MRIIHPEYRNEHQDTNYPFADTASMISRDKIILSQGMFIDASIFPIGGTERLYISSLVVGNRLVTIWIGCPANAQLASGSFDPLAPPAAIDLAEIARAEPTLAVDVADRNAVVSLRQADLGYDEHR